MHPVTCLFHFLSLFPRFCIRSIMRVYRELREGSKGLRRGISLRTPSEVPLKSLWTPSEPPLNPERKHTSGRTDKNKRKEGVRSTAIPLHPGYTLPVYFRNTGSSTEITNGVSVRLKWQANLSSSGRHESFFLVQGDQLSAQNTA